MLKEQLLLDEEKTRALHPNHAEETCMMLHHSDHESCVQESNHSLEPIVSHVSTKDSYGSTDISVPVRNENKNTDPPTFQSSGPIRPSNTKGSRVLKYHGSNTASQNKKVRRQHLATHKEDDALLEYNSTYNITEFDENRDGRTGNDERVTIWIWIQILFRQFFAFLVDVWHLILYIEKDDYTDDDSLHDETDSINRTAATSFLSNSNHQGSHYQIYRSVGGMKRNTTSVSSSSSAGTYHGRVDASGVDDGDPSYVSHSVASSTSRISSYNHSNQNQFHGNHFDHSSHYYSNSHYKKTCRCCNRRRWVGRVLWLFILALAYAAERCTFKILVDRMGPFRIVVGAQGVLGLYIIFLALIILWQTFSFHHFVKRWFLKIFRGESFKGRGYTGLSFNMINEGKKIVLLPLGDIGMIAVLDSVSLLLAVVSAAKVSPILIIILVHSNIPLVLLMTRSLGIHRSSRTTSTMSQEQVLEQGSTGRRLLLYQVIGMILIIMSILGSVLPLFIPKADPTKFVTGIASFPVADTTSKWNTVLFLLSCIPAAASHVYKHHSLLSIAQPIDVNLLNCILTIASLFFVALISPLMYSLQGFAASATTVPTVEQNMRLWMTLYPPHNFSNSFHDGIRCVIGCLPEVVQLSGYPEVAHCRFAWLLMLIHVASVLTVQYSVDKMCRSEAPKLSCRSLSWGIITGATSMYFYGSFDFHSLAFWSLCTAALAVGSEMYQLASVQIDTFETVYDVPDVSDDNIPRES